jgi:nitroimidazol reductase NimA-like FMN-containing flavoprotein (pyridoxamine 5'-phosphate oxidase superfamily)
MGSNQPTQIGEEMNDDEALSLLEATGHGVLSLAQGGRAYGFPVSFGYDDEAERLLLEFLNIGESKKQRFAAVDAEVTLTVYEFDHTDRWESAIVTGTLHSVDAADLPERSVASFAVRADDGAEEVRWAGAADLEREWYEIRPTSITGRRRNASEPEP